MLNTVLFDLDGTLLPLNQAEFTKAYVTRLSMRLASLGYDPKAVAEALWLGVGAMVKGAGETTNEETFWRVFENALGAGIREKAAFFEDFYRGEFQEIATITSPSPLVPSLIATLKKKGLRLVLATNPFFPKIATDSRIRWAGLSPDDFCHVTYYENSHFCKPNPLYYKEIASTLSLSPEACLMVGNDVEEDMMSRELGFDVFLLTDCILNPKGKDISAYPNGDFHALTAYIEAKL